MNLFNKIAIVSGLAVCLCACQKEELPSPDSSASSTSNGMNQRVSNPTGSNDGSGTSSYRNHGGRTYDSLDIVGGGDGDRDGGAGRRMNPSANGKDSLGTDTHGDNNTGSGEIVGGGDGDRDGGDDGSKKPNKG